MQYKSLGVISGMYIFKPLVAKEAKELFVEFTSHIFMILMCYDEAEVLLLVKPRAHPRIVPKRVKEVPTIRDTPRDMGLYMCEPLRALISNDNGPGWRRGIRQRRSL